MSNLQSVKIFENFLEEEDLERIKFDLSQAIWSNGASSLSSAEEHDILFWRCDTPCDSFYTQHLLNKIEEVNNKEFVWLDMPGPYFNGQTFGQDASLHRDCDLEKGVTFLLYCTEKYKVEMGGFTLFKEEKNEIIITPKYNRAVFFPGSVEHKAFSFSRPWHPLRISLAFKLKTR